MWWNKHFNKWIDICIEDPLKTWKEARRYFKKPQISIHLFDNITFNCPFASYSSVAKILDIKSFDVGWKDKYDSPRHERNPYIWVCFFKQFGFSINWDVIYKDELGDTHPGDSFYWEYLLDYLKYDKRLSDVPFWTYSSKIYKKNKKEFILNIPIVTMSLNKQGLEELKFEIEVNNG